MYVTNDIHKIYSPGDKPSTKITLKAVRNRTKAFIKKSNYVRPDNHFDLIISNCKFCNT